MRNDILWIIAARSGSKSIPNKNIRILGKLPLLAYRIKSALSISRSDDILLSTDSEEYKLIGEKYGIKVPFLRPDFLSDDKASSIDVVLHAMEYVLKFTNREYEYVGLLEPTSPFIYYKDLINAVEILDSNHIANGIVACKETRPNTFFIQDDSEYLETLSIRFNNQTKLGRQEFSRQITPSGGFYISKWKNFMEEKTFYTNLTIPYLIPDECSLEIDEPIDWDWAEFLLKNKNIEIEKIYSHDLNLKLL